MLGICNSTEAPRSSGMDNRLYGLLTNQISIPHSTDYVPPIVNFERRYNVRTD